MASIEVVTDDVTIVDVDTGALVVGATLVVGTTLVTAVTDVVGATLVLGTVLAGSIDVDTAIVVVGTETTLGVALTLLVVDSELTGTLDAVVRSALGSSSMVRARMTAPATAVNATASFIQVGVVATGALVEGRGATRRGRGEASDSTDTGRDASGNRARDAACS